MPDHRIKGQYRGTAADVFKTFLKLGLTSFGGPVAHLAYFHKELVERQRWLSESQFSQLLGLCQFLPGPASSQLGFALGLVRAGWTGALAAFVGFTLPSALLMVMFASLIGALSGPWMNAVVHGLKLVAFAVVADAVLGMFAKLCPDRLRRSIALASACTLLLAGSAAAQLWVVAVSAITGLLFCRPRNDSEPHSLPIHYSRGAGLCLLAAFALLLAILPMLATAPGTADLVSLPAVADAFYRAGALVFGGGHVVLPLLADSVVGTGWISQQDFLAGYGAAQAMPGPLFAFSAYLGALIPGAGPAWLTATLALLMIFLPGFLLLAAVLPLWLSVARNSRATRAIAGVNAAVVGLLFAALYDPVFTSAIRSATDMALGLTAFSLLAIWRLSPLLVVIGCVVASLALAAL